MKDECYDPRVLSSRDVDLTVMFNEAAEEADFDGIPDSTELQEFLLQITVGIPLPDDVYLNGDRKWCADWQAKESDKVICTTYSSKDRLLVIVDLADGRYQRLPCDLSGEDPLRPLRFGLEQVFDTE